MRCHSRSDSTAQYSAASLLTGCGLGASGRFDLMGARADQRLDERDFCMTTAFVNVSYNSLIPRRECSARGDNSVKDLGIDLLPRLTDYCACSLPGTVTLLCVFRCRVGTWAMLSAVEGLLDQGIRGSGDQRIREMCVGEEGDDSSLEVEPDWARAGAGQQFFSGATHGHESHSLGCHGAAILQSANPGLRARDVQLGEG